MLEVKSVDQYYGESHTLWDLSLGATTGQCTVLMGRNGVGKTTLLKVIMGLLPARRGSVSVGGVELTRRAASDRAQAGVGYVPQGRDIFPQLSVEENLRLGLLGRRRGPVTDKQLLEKVYGLFPVLSRMARRRGGDLSGGQQQQLAIGRALCLDPSLLLLDEPTEGIQPNIVAEIGDVLQQLVAEGLTLLLVEQKLPFARRVADHFFVLDRGRVVASGAMGELTPELVQRHLVV